MSIGFLVFIAIIVFILDETGEDSYHAKIFDGTTEGMYKKKWVNTPLKGRFN